MQTLLHLIGSALPEAFGERLAVWCRDRQTRCVPAGTSVWQIDLPALLREPLLHELLPLARREGLMLAVSGVRTTPRAVLFDLDATLTACEFLDTLAAEIGLGDATRELTCAAMEGRMDFAASYRARLRLFAGTPVRRIEALIDRLPLAGGAAELIAALRCRGICTAIVTGGYGRVGRAIQQRLGIDLLYATELEERAGCLTGSLAGPMLDAQAKVAALDDLCLRCGVTRTDCLAVGDGANDLPLLAAAGSGVLYTSLPAGGRPALPIVRLLELPHFHF